MRRRIPKVSARALATIVGVVIILGVVLVLFRYSSDIRRSFERASLPEPVDYQDVKQGATLPTSRPAAPAQEVESTPSVSPPYQGGDQRGGQLPAEINLSVPFTAQAPHGVWEAPYKEFCEEASVLMAASYLNGEDIPTPDDADQKMLAIKAFTDKLGYPEDTTAAETAVILRDYFKIDEVEVLPQPTVQDLKEALAAGKLVIVPAAGRLLGNPYYTPPGPLYHMFVIKGYTADGKFITNDPGTRRGADFLYSEATIMNAMHDWRADKDIERGEKVVLIVG